MNGDRRGIAATALMVIALLGWGAEVFPGDIETDPCSFPGPARCSLRGLQAVHVVVEHIDAEAEQDGLTRAQIQTDVELRLRKAGIKVLTRDELFKAPGQPHLYVKANPMKHNTLDIYSYSISVEFRQSVFLARQPSIAAYASTWSVDGVGKVGVENLGRSIRQSIGDKVDEFINAYLAMNPKQ